MGAGIPRIRIRIGWDTRSAIGTDALMVDTVGFNDQSWLDTIGHPHTEMLHVTERLHRADLGHLEIEFTLEDPGAYSKPWVIKRVADLDTKDEIGEYVCIDKDAPHMVGK